MKDGAERQFFARVCGSVLCIFLAGLAVSCASVRTLPEPIPPAPEPAADDTEMVAPSNWQLDVTFPDWSGKINANLTVNNLLSFSMYHGQGVLYLTATDCERVSVRVNNRKIRTPSLKNGITYAVDIASATKDGLNTLQVSGIAADATGTVRVCIPYPEVKPGSLGDSGIPRDAIKLIDTIISADVAQGFPSAQLAIIKDGRLVYHKNWGTVQTYDEDGTPVPDAKNVTDTTMYDLASVTKMFSVNYALQYLVTQGKVTLETKITDILGDDFVDAMIDFTYRGHDAIPFAKNKAWKSALTIRDVLTHTAGFHPGPPFYNDTYAIDKDNADDEPKNILYAGVDGSDETRKRTLQQLFRMPLMYEPGTQLVYSDVDFMLLCFIIEKITGQPLDDFLRETFWKPLGLEHIMYNPLAHGFSADDCVATELNGNTGAHTVDFTGVRTQVIQGEVHDGNAFYAMGGVSGHAGLFANATELAVLASVMLTGGYGEHRFFSRNVIDTFTGPQSIAFADWALGWWRQGAFGTMRHFGSICSPEAFGHQGFTGTLAFVEPKHHLVVVFLTNKIHAPAVSGGDLKNQFSGNYYTCGTTGFVPQILLLGLNGNTSHALWRSVLTDMIADTERLVAAGNDMPADDPRVRSLHALQSALKKY